MYKKCQHLSYLTFTFPIFSLRSKFGIENLASLIWGVLSKVKVNSSENMAIFLAIGAVNKDINIKR